ncbi:TPA: hypothetical protein RPE36_004157 [Salmonella enterica]|nr:hypothetical protein [Salmonella enterica]
MLNPHEELASGNRANIRFPVAINSRRLSKFVVCLLQCVDSDLLLIDVIVLCGVGAFQFCYALTGSLQLRNILSTLSDILLRQSTPGIDLLSGFFVTFLRFCYTLFAASSSTRSFPTRATLKFHSVG